MSPVFVHRLAVLTGAALLGALAALALAEQRPQGSAAPSFVGAPAPAGWNTAFAGSRGPTGDAQRTTCGEVLAPESMGVTHPVLPCGVRLVLRHGDRQVLTEVIDNKLVEPGLELEVTEALARLLGLHGTREIEWRFATESGG